MIDRNREAARHKREAHATEVTELLMSVSPSRKAEAIEHSTMTEGV
jgi:hypothetical protein